MKKLTFERSKVQKEAIKRLLAYQRNKLYPIYIAFSSNDCERMLEERISDFINRINEILVTTAFTDKDKDLCRELIQILHSKERQSSESRQRGMKIIEKLIQRMKVMTHSFNAK